MGVVNDPGRASKRSQEEDKPRIGTPVGGGLACGFFGAPFGRLLDPHDAVGVGIKGEADAPEPGDAVGDREMPPTGDIEAPFGDEFLRRIRGADPYGERKFVEAVENGHQLLGRCGLRACTRGFTPGPAESPGKEEQEADQAWRPDEEHVCVPVPEPWRLRIGRIQDGSSRQRDACFPDGGAEGGVRVSDPDTDEFPVA